MIENQVIESLKIEGDKIMVSSVDLAKFFDKEHKNLLASVKKIEESKPEFCRLNFKPAEYIDAQGKPRPCQLMTEEGFNLIVMGFTGEKALEYKIMFIEAFSEMKNKIKQQPKKYQNQINSREQEILAAGFMLIEYVEAAKFIAVPSLLREVKRQTGTDLFPIIENSKIMGNIKDEDIMLNPAKIDALFKDKLAQIGLTHKKEGVNINRFLEMQGYQHKEQSLKQWIPKESLDNTIVQKAACASNNGYQTYNLWWNKNWIETQIDDYIEQNA